MLKSRLNCLSVKTLLFFLLTVSLTGCSRIEGIKAMFKEEEEATASEAPETEDDYHKLEDDRFYVKSGEIFEKGYIPSGNILAEDAIVKKADSSRIFSLVGDEDRIPTLYEDDQLIYYTETEMPSSFTWERFQDNGYSPGIYGLESDESNKLRYVKGVSGCNKNSSAAVVMSTLTLPEGTTFMIVDKAGGINLSPSYLTEGGSLSGFSKGDRADLECYIGTNLVEIPAIADTLVLSSMEVFTSNSYSMSSEGYAIIDVPEEIFSGYYLLNGRGVIRYVKGKRSEGQEGTDLTKPYYYYDEKGHEYSYPEWLEYMGENVESELNLEPDGSLAINNEDDRTNVRITINYEKFDGEESTLPPSAEMEGMQFEKTGNNNKGTLSLTLDELGAGEHTVNLYNSAKYKINSTLQQEAAREPEEETDAEEAEIFGEE